MAVLDFVLLACFGVERVLWDRRVGLEVARIGLLGAELLLELILGGD